MFHSLAPRNSGSSSGSSSEVVPLAVGLGVGVPCAITVVILAWLYARHRRVAREEDERHENIDIDGDVTLYENNIGVEDEKYAVRPKIRRDDSSSFMYTPYIQDRSSQSVDGFSRSMTSVLGPSPFHQSSEMLRTPRSFSASSASMQWQAPRLPPQPWNDHASASNSYASSHTLSSVPSSPGDNEPEASDSEESVLSFDATHRDSVALDDPDFRRVSTVSRNKTPPLSSSHSVRLSMGHRATFGYEGDGSDDPRLSTASFTSLHTARSNGRQLMPNAQFSDSKTSLAHSSLANEIHPEDYTNEGVDSEINDTYEYTGDSFENSNVSDIQFERAQDETESVAMPQPERVQPEHAELDFTEPQETQVEPQFSEEVYAEPQDTQAEPRYSQTERIDPQESQSEPVHAELQETHVEPQHSETVHAEPENVEAFAPEVEPENAPVEPVTETVQEPSEYGYNQLPTPETTPAPADNEPVPNVQSTPYLGPTPETSYDTSLDSPWGSNNDFLPQRPPSPALSSAPSSVYPESSISNRYGSSQPSSPQVGRSPLPPFVPSFSDYMDLPDVPSSGGFKPHSSKRLAHMAPKNARPPVPAPRNSIAVLDESVFIQPKRKFGAKSRGKPQHVG